MMFDNAHLDLHIGKKIRPSKSLYALEDLEKYFIEKCVNTGIKYSHDVTAKENPYFKTLNYTTYAGMFIMHPLEFNLSLHQMYDAKADNLDALSHVEVIKNRLCSGDGSKYVRIDGEEKKVASGKFKYVICLPGSNKFYDHVSKKKFVSICKTHGSDVVVKPHPITNQKVLDEVKLFAGNAFVADKDDDLYSYIENCEKVYTTHISESALTSVVLGKSIEPVEKYSAKFTGSFSHINHFCFTESNPIDVVGKIFASPKSGVVHPIADADWKNKIDLYFEYIMAKRLMYFGSYLE